ncbi:MAG: sulfatase [Gammaproteobacteria bacterium]|nr:sulfatase [Gammaproteobacteria bacterium]
MKSVTVLAFLVLLLSLVAPPVIAGAVPEAKRPSILLAISDDQSWPHTSVAGSPFVETPNLDDLAASGFYFANGYAGSPGCSPSRAALLTGRHHWMIGPAGTHGSSFPVRYKTFVDILEDAGYKVGFTGKGWGPGDWLAGGHDRNPAGVEYNNIELGKDRKKGILNSDYAANFAQFLSERDEGQPFVFWYGAKEPHLAYAEEPHSASARAKVEVPGFLPDTPTTRDTLLDYADEIEHFDDHLGRIVDILEASGELENTLVIVTSDNGMPLPRAKATGFDYGSHVPLAMYWGKHPTKGVSIDAPVGFVDLSATILAFAGEEVPTEYVGTSLLDLLQGDVDALDPDRAVFSGRERHSSSRYQNLSYPQRMMRRGDYLIIWSIKPDRHPAGQPREIVDGRLGEPHGAYYDMGPSMIKRELIARRDDPYIGPFFELAVAGNPEWQFFNVIDDPDCMNDLAEDPEFSELFDEYQQQLLNTLQETGDPRVLGYGDIWEDYPRIGGKMRYFPKLDGTTE